MPTDELPGTDLELPLVRPGLAMSRGRRALLLGGLALVLGGLAAFNVAGHEAGLDRRVGGLVDVVVAREPICAGERLATRGCWRSAVCPRG